MTASAQDELKLPKCNRFNKQNNYFVGAATEPPRSLMETYGVNDLMRRSHSGRERSGYKMNPLPAFAILVWDPPYSLGSSPWGVLPYMAARQGIVLILSVLNRLYHFARVCPKTLDRV